jgi:hypothetical protein
VSHMAFPSSPQRIPVVPALTLTGLNPVDRVNLVSRSHHHD